MSVGRPRIGPLLAYAAEVQEALERERRHAQRPRSPAVPFVPKPEAPPPKGWQDLRGDIAEEFAALTAFDPRGQGFHIVGPKGAGRVREARDRGGILLAGERVTREELDQRQLLLPAGDNYFCR
jgi:hypothetical protein